MAAITKIIPRSINTTGNYVVASIEASANVVAGNLKTDNLLYANGSPYAFTTNAAGSNTQIQFNNSDSFAGSANLTFNSTTKTLSVDNIQVTGNITPTANVTYDLGNSTNRFKDLYLSGNTLQIGDGAITIDGNSMVLTDPLGGTFVVDGSNAAYASLAAYVTESNQSNITQVGTLVSLDVLTSITTANIKTDYLLHANGSAYTASDFTNDAGYLVSSNLSGYATESYVGNAVANLVASAPAALDTLNELANALGNDASFSTSITNSLANKLNSNAFTWANISGKPTLGNISTLNIDGNSGNILYGNGVFSSAPVVYGNANVVTLLSSFGSNTITTTGNITAGNANLGNAVIANFFTGNGHYLTDLLGTQVTGEVAFANKANSVAGANVSGEVAFSATANSVAVANVTGIGNIATINKDGNASNILYGNGVFASAPVSYGDSNVATYLPTYTGNLSPDNLIVTTHSNLGDVGNIVITGGTTGQLLTTDGNGSLSWSTVTGGSGGTSESTVTAVDTFTGDGANTTFTLSVTPQNINQTFVNYNGALQLRAAYTVTGADITFSEAPADGSLIEVTTTMGVQPTGSSSLIVRNYTANGVQTQFAVTANVTASSILVTENGLLQTPATDYTVSGSTLTFSTAPGNGVKVQVRELGTSVATITPAGSNTQILFNDAGQFGNSTNFTFNKSTSRLTTANLTITAKTNLNSVSNITITGGTSGQYLQTDGTGNLVWANVSPGTSNARNIINSYVFGS